MEPEIRTVPDRKVLYVTRSGGPFWQIAGPAFDAIVNHVQTHNLQDSVEECLGYFPDDPSTTPEDQCRYVAGYFLKNDVPAEGETEIMTIPGGRCAVFSHIGPYDTLGNTWQAVYRDWLPTSGQQLRNCPPYEVYTVTDHSKPEELVTEIHVPIQ